MSEVKTIVPARTVKNATSINVASKPWASRTVPNTNKTMMALKNARKTGASPPQSLLRAAPT